MTRRRWRCRFTSRWGTMITMMGKRRSNWRMQGGIRTRGGSCRGGGIGSDPFVTLLVLDSNKPRINKEDWERQKWWIEANLAQVSGKHWTICIAHHPLFSNGMHGDNGVLQKEWGPIFRRYNLDFYVCGHDHDLQHLRLAGWPMSFLLVGGGGAGTRSMRRDDRGPFSRSVYGFLHLNITRERASGRYLTSGLGVVHRFEQGPNGNIRVLSTTGRDQPTTKPLKVIQGFEEEATGPSTRAATRPATQATQPAR
jgi:hypothetical protein